MMRCRSLAEMPVRRVDISKIARNHTLSGLWVFSSSVPDVRLVWCPQSAHSNVVPSRMVHTRLPLQRAHDGSLKLTRFRGHPTFWVEGVHDVEAKSTLP